MRQRSEVIVILAVAAFALSGVIGVKIMGSGTDVRVDPGLDPAPVTIEPTVVRTAQGGGAWFQSFRMYCNPVDVDTRLRWQPAPGTPEGDMYKAACYALAGRIDQARDVIDGLPQDVQFRAAGVVFDAGHPAADGGDEIAAGPLMELVVEYWPNHYMALYHAGAAAYERGDYGAAPHYLERFLSEYAQEDGWRSNAIEMLERMERGGR